MILLQAELRCRERAQNAVVLSSSSSSPWVKAKGENVWMRCKELVGWLVQSKKEEGKSVLFRIPFPPLLSSTFSFSTVFTTIKLRGVSAIDLTIR